MKLLFCRSCGDLIRLWGTWRACSCGKVRGRYVDQEKVEYTGGTHAMPLGLDNHTMEKVARLPEGKPGSVSMFRISGNSKNWRRAS